MPVDLLALVASGAAAFVTSKVSEYFDSSKLKQHFEEAASHAVSLCEEDFPAGTSEWNEFVSFLNTPLRVKQLVEALVQQRALPDCQPWCQPLLEEFLFRLAGGLMETTPAKERGGFLSLSIQLALVEQRLNREIVRQGAVPAVTTDAPALTSNEFSAMAHKALNFVAATGGGVPLASRWDTVNG